MKKQNQIDFTDSPVAWFVMLERAKQTGNIEHQKLAIQELNRLGVSVAFINPKDAEGESNDK